MRDINGLALEIHQTALDHGFWPAEGRNLGEMLMLATSELAEALEEDRSGRPHVWFLHEEMCALTIATGVRSADEREVSGVKCNCNPKPEGSLVEVIDCIIRCLDTGQYLAGMTQYTVYDVIRMKMDYNHKRAYKHGKGY